MGSMALHQSKNTLPAFCRELPAGEALPEWLELIPAGTFTGRDGRSWSNPNPQTVIDATLALNKALQVDVEHSSYLKAPNGDPAPAVGWIEPESLEVRDGAVLGKFDWNQDGEEILKGKKQV